jgi:hypothetical protein
MDELLTLERQGWEALATEGNAGAAFYSAVLRDDAVMLFPGGIRITGRDRILDSLGAQPWESFRIDDAHVTSLTPDVVTLVYKVSARRGGDRPYVALVSSTYVRDQAWQLVVHQHTPV